VNFHTDIGLGMNSATEHPEEAREFLEWVTGSEFAAAYGNAVVGQVPLTAQPVELEDPLLAAFVASTTECEVTIRPAYQFLDRGDPNTTLELFRVSAAVLQGEMSPEQAAAELQAALDSWYTPRS
jgi:raffinose/stachyose/melibiose transport system substrate-binding protein